MEKKKASLTLFLAIIIIMGAEINNYSVVSAEHTLVNVEEGTTIYYDLRALEYDRDLLNQFVSAANISFEPLDSLTGSKLYVKLLRVGMESFSMIDTVFGGSASKNETTVDLAAGILVSKDTRFNLNGTIVTLPAGSGLGLPFIFGATSSFSLANLTLSSVFPLPIILSQEWITHEATLSNLGDIATVTATENWFNVSLKLDVAQQNTFIDGKLSWRKSDGIMAEINLEATNTTTKESIVKIDATLSETPVVTRADINIGDYYVLTLNRSALDATSNDEATTELINELDANLSDAIGEPVLEFVVTDVEGLFYEITPIIVDPQTNTKTNGNATWMIGFGKIPQGPIGGIGALATNQTAIRDNATLGVLTSPDWSIYQAWDKNTFSIEGQLLANIINELTGLSNLVGNVSITLEPTISVSASSNIVANETHYGSRMSFSVENALLNSSQLQDSNATVFVTLSLNGTLTISTYYAKGETPYLDWLDITLEGSLILDTYVKDISEEPIASTEIGGISLGLSLDGNYRSIDQLEGVDNQVLATIVIIMIVAGVAGTGYALIALLQKRG